MFPEVDTGNPEAVAVEVKASYLAMYPTADPAFVPAAFRWIQEVFLGGYADYQAIDARYHDLEHTLQGTLCMVRLLRERHRAEAKPAVPQRMFELGLLAILFHDTGYLKKKTDASGTGAKYTLTHVTRSVQFAEAFLAQRGLAIGEIRSIQNMIRCTGVHVNLERIPFQSEVEKIIGFALGTGDLLGQMSAPDYVDKLPTLFEEFAESERYYDGKMAVTQSFASPEDLISKTPEFWNGYVLPKLTRDFWGLYRFLNQPYPNGPNEYMRKVEANIAQIGRKLAELRAARTPGDRP